MKLDIDKANRFTLNLLKDTLQIQSSHTDFLKMLFPDSLQYHDEQSLLDFLFDADTTYQNKRSIFINGNITKKKNSTYSRAHQMELSFIAKQQNYTSCFKEMVQLLTCSFPELVTSTLTALIDKDIEKYPSDFYTALIHCIEKDEQHKLLALLVMWSVFGESQKETCNLNRLTSSCPHLPFAGVVSTLGFNKDSIAAVGIKEENAMGCVAFHIHQILVVDNFGSIFKGMISHLLEPLTVEGNNFLHFNLHRFVAVSLVIQWSIECDFFH